MHEFRKFSDIITRSKFCTQPKCKEANRFGIRFITQSLTPRGTSFRPGKHSEYQFNYSLREFPRFFISHPIFSKEWVVLRDACVSRFDSSIDRDQEINDIGDRPRGNYILEIFRCTRDLENCSFLWKFQCEKSDRHFNIFIKFSNLKSMKKFKKNLY